MNKDEAKARIEAIEREAAELRRIIEAPEQAWEPKDLVGKLCYVWDAGGPKSRALVLDYDPGNTWPFRTAGIPFEHAEPIPADEVEKTIYRKSRYNWSKAPNWAEWMATDSDGKVWAYCQEPSDEIVSWQAHGKVSMLSRPGKACRDWRESLERRP